MTTVGQVAIEEQNPWPGLGSFDESAERFFNGRRNESAELRRMVLNAPLTVLFGASGLGKTSLVQAGLFPLLRKEHYLPVYVRLDLRDRSVPLIDQVKSALQAQCLARNIDAPAMRKEESLWRYLHRAGLELWSEQNHLLTPVFVFDQFEEAFTLGAENPGAVARLRIDLADLIENRLPTALAGTVESHEGAGETLSLDRQNYKVLLSFREDYLPAVEGWKRDLPSILHNRVRLLPMSAERAFEAVYKTAPHLVDEDLARKIVDFVAAAQEGEGGKVTAAVGEATELSVEPALLSLVCSGLNEKRKAQGKAKFDVELLAGSGQFIISDYYASSVGDLPESVQRFIENELITERGFRKPCDIDDARSVHGVKDRELRLLVDRRVLRIEPQRGTEQVELTHDLLTRVVREHRDRERERARVQRQRRRMAVFGAVAAVLAGLVVVFALLYQRAEQRTREALAASENEKHATEQSRQAEILAQTKSAEAVESEEKLRLETVRMRERILEDLQIEVALSNSLANLAPDAAYQWHEIEAMKLLEQGNLPSALEEADKAVRRAPDSSITRNTRGYAYLLAKKPAQALEDFEYIRNNIDPHSALNHLDLTITYALLERPADARKAIDEAIKYFFYGYNTGAQELEISPDIELATGGKRLYASPDALRVALPYLRALLSDYFGDPDFASQLVRADQDAADRRVVQSTKEDGYFIALNWAYLHENKKEKGRREDYGAFAGQAALWERLGLRDWAACYYEKFEEKHRELREGRYDQLAKWANQQLAGLGQRAPYPCPRGDQERNENDPRFLEVMARQSIDQEKYEDARTYVDQAIKKLPNNFELLLLRAEVHWRLAVDANQKYLAALKKDPEEAPQFKANRTRALKVLLEDSKTIIKLDPKTADAYYWRGVADFWLSESPEPSERTLNDFRTALRWDVTQLSALYDLSYYLGKHENTRSEALRDAEAYDRFYPGGSFFDAPGTVLAGEADIHNQLKEFPAALDAIERAIAFDATDLNNYKIRAAAEHGLGLDESQVLRRQAEGYMQAGDTLKQRGNIKDANAADAAYQAAWRILAENHGSAGQAELRCNSDGTVCEKIEVVHSLGATVESVIPELPPGESKVRIVKIDRGSEDGLLAGAQGDFVAKDGKKRIGQAEVLSVDARSAMVEIRIDGPFDDGLAKQGGIVQLHVAASR
jgi:Tfp pilus assembly protein PilF